MFHKLAVLGFVRRQSVQDAGIFLAPFHQVVCASLFGSFSFTFPVGFTENNLLD